MKIIDLSKRSDMPQMAANRIIHIGQRHCYDQVQDDNGRWVIEPGARYKPNKLYEFLETIPDGFLDLIMLDIESEPLKAVTAGDPDAVSDFIQMADDTHNAVPGADVGFYDIPRAGPFLMHNLRQWVELNQHLEPVLVATDVIFQPHYWPGNLPIVGWLRRLRTNARAIRRSKITKGFPYYPVLMATMHGHKKTPWPKSDFVLMAETTVGITQPETIIVWGGVENQEMTGDYVAAAQSALDERKHDQD